MLDMRGEYLRKCLLFNCSPHHVGKGFFSELKNQFTSFLNLCIEGLNCGYRLS
jgi:hypothetical protein